MGHGLSCKYSLKCIGNAINRAPRKTSALKHHSEQAVHLGAICHINNRGYTNKC